jgi:hypothetical protein
MRKTPIVRLVFALLGLLVVLLVGGPAGANVAILEDGCGTVQAYELCPGDCNQESCQSWCQDALPGCKAAATGHSCNGTTCWCRCTNSEDK